MPGWADDRALANHTVTALQSLVEDCNLLAADLPPVRREKLAKLLRRVQQERASIMAELTLIDSHYESIALAGPRGIPGRDHGFAVDAVALHVIVHVVGQEMGRRQRFCTGAEGNAQARAFRGQQSLEFSAACFGASQ